MLDKSPRPATVNVPNDLAMKSDGAIYVTDNRSGFVDKDRNPQWSPANLSDCTRADVDAYFVSADPDLTF